MSSPGEARSARGWLMALPTFVWLAAVGFTIGALIALS